MSATLEAPRQTAAATDAEPASLLRDILSRVDAIGVAQQRPSPIHLKTWEEIERFAEKAARSGMVPKDYAGKADAICIAVQMGSELGLAPMQALQNIAVINGRPAIWGDAMLGLCQASPKCQSIREWSEGEGDALTFYCEAIRHGDPTPKLGRFSVADAKQAGLWKDGPKTKKMGRDGPYEVDSGPWWSYPLRMLQMRARGFGLRDAFADVLKGLISAEEARDIPFEATGLTPTLSVQKTSSEVRQAINDAIPLQPAAAAMPRPPRKTEDDPVNPAPSRNLVVRDEIIARYAAVATRKEYLAVTGEYLKRMDWFRENKPAIANEISTAMSNAWDRTGVDSEPDEPAVDDDPFAPGVEIAGAEKMASG